MSAVPSSIASPCMGVCTMDESGRMCLGCCRTIGEIAEWLAMTPAERSRIIGELPARRVRREGFGTRLVARTCSACGNAFGCGAEDGEHSCWCAAYPVVAPVEGASCLCPACLAAASRRG